MRKNSTQAFICFVLSVFFFIFSQPGLFFDSGCAFFAWVAYVPLFLLLDSLSIKSSFLPGFLYGAVSYLLLCYWFSAFGTVAISFVSLLFGIYFSIAFFLICFVRDNLPPSFQGFYWIIRFFILLSVEYLRTKGVFAFSYGVIGYTQWKNPVFLRLSSLFGVWGISFLIYLFNSLLSKLIRERDFSKNISEIRICFSLFLGIAVFSLVSSFFDSDAATKKVTVALIQDASSTDSFTVEQYAQDVRLLESLSEEALSSHPEVDLVVWPETAVVPDIFFNLYNTDDRKRHAIAEQLVDYLSQKRTSFIIGNSFFEGNATHNSALYFNSEAQKVEVYSKNRLVPFTEYWPDFLDFKLFDGIKQRLNCDYFSAGNEITVFEVNSVRFCVPICFEDSFSPFIRRMKRSGADFFVNISDDAWADSSAAQNMHLSMSVFRSAEYAVPFVRSTIDGVTCLIDRRGNVVKKLNVNEDAFLVCDVEVCPSQNTFYGMTGDFFIIFITAVTLILLLILSIRFVKVGVYGRR